jgi:hypothetical protein
MVLSCPSQWSPALNPNSFPAMKPSELFGVFVRAAGFAIVLYGLYEIWDGFENAVKNLFPANKTEDG